MKKGPRGKRPFNLNALVDICDVFGTKWRRGGHVLGKIIGGRQNIMSNDADLDEKC